MGRQITRWLQLVSTVVLASLLMLAYLPQTTRAHALDEYLQAVYITLTPARVLLEFDLTPGVLIAPQVLAGLDVDNDQVISTSEGTAFASALLADVHVWIDDQPLALTLATSQFPSVLNLNAGVGGMRLLATADLPSSTSGTHRLRLQNTHQPVRSAYLINLLQPKPDEIRVMQQDRDENAHSLAVTYDIVGHATGTELTGGHANPGGTQQLIDTLSAPTLTASLFALGMGLAIVLGGLHALTPGHGKTLVAAYLVGSRGTIQHAIFLGGIVTFTHTISVIAVGLLALLARQFIAPNLLVPLLETISGVLVLLLGLRLVQARWRAWRAGPAHAHVHDHGIGPHNHTHLSDAHSHSHSHRDPAHPNISRGSLLAMGISGGLVPCPEALGIMLVAIGLNRIGLGLGLIVAFSAGLAAVLIMIGILLVRSKSLLDRFSKPGAGLTQALPLIGAIIVMLLGAGLVIKGLTS